MDQRKKIVCAAFLVLLSITDAYAQAVPPNIAEFTEDYYNVIGEPDLLVSISGNPEYESGETAGIFIQLLNSGLIYGFENENIPDPANGEETANAQTELNLEYDATTAINILSTLENNNDAPVRILSGLQHGGSLRSGETSLPLKFDIEVYKNAPAGTYALTLNLTYQYQYDVQVEGSLINYWLIPKNQTLPVRIKVKPRAVFEIENVSADFMPGRSGILAITYKNVGNQPAYEAVASIEVADPISTTDDNAFLGTLGPGDSYQAKYLIKIDNDATAKNYWINTEIGFKNEHGDTRMSDMLKASVSVEETVPFTKKFGYAAYLIAIAVILGAILHRYLGKKS